MGQIIIYVVILITGIVSFILTWIYLQEEIQNKPKKKSSPIQFTSEKIIEEKPSIKYAIAVNPITDEREEVAEQDCCLANGIINGEELTFINTEAFPYYVSQFSSNYYIIDDLLKYKWFLENYMDSSVFFKSGNGFNIRILKIKEWIKEGIFEKDDVYEHEFKKLFKTDPDSSKDTCNISNNSQQYLNFREYYGRDYNKKFYENLLTADSGKLISLSDCSQFKRMENDFIYIEKGVPVKIYSLEDIREKINFY